MSTINKHDCLKNLRHNFDLEIPTQLLGLEPEEGGIRLLSLFFNQALPHNAVDALSAGMKCSFVKWGLAYLGLQQAKGIIPYLPGEGEKLDVAEITVTNVNMAIIEVILSLLRSILDTKTVAEVIGDTFPAEEETHLGLRLVPVAYIYVVIYVKEGNLGNNYVRTVFATNFIDIVLQCYNHICQTFDTQASEDNRGSNSNNFKKTLSSRRWLPDLDYLSHLHQRILSYLSASSPLFLGKIAKSTLLKCDPEIRATVYSRLASKKKC